MPRPPTAIVPLLLSFASRLDTRTWRKAQWLPLGAVPARLLRHPDEGAGPLAFGHTGPPHAVVLPDGWTEPLRIHPESPRKADSGIAPPAASRSVRGPVPEVGT